METCFDIFIHKKKASKLAKPQAAQINYFKHPNVSKYNPIMGENMQRGL